MNNDKAMNFLRHLSDLAPNAPLSEALGMLNALADPATASYGVHFSELADQYMRNGQTISAIKEVRRDNHVPGVFMLREARDAVVERMDRMHWPL